MRYKGQYRPSQLLCPESYTWHDINRSQELLQTAKYSRLEESGQAADEDGSVDLPQVRDQQNSRERILHLKRCFVPRLSSYIEGEPSLTRTTAGCGRMMMEKKSQNMPGWWVPSAPTECCCTENDEKVSH